MASVLMVLIDSLIDRSGARADKRKNRRVVLRGHRPDRRETGTVHQRALYQRGTHTHTHTHTVV